ncbi:MAG: GTP cyclohydrolase IIa [Halobacteriales archaeon]|nr:GTP cyclohydrolase IIa [Halobacteriales archaeon]
MTNTQVTLVQIDNYGPWTVTPEPRREPDLQALQATLFADLAELIGNRDGYVFYTRFDNMIAVTNGIDMDAHATIQESIGNRYPITVSMGVGVDTTPATALEAATERLQSAGSAQEADRIEVLSGAPIAPADRTEDDVQIAHFDVNDATGKYTDELHAFDSLVTIERGYVSLAAHLREAYDSLAFFVGGDNIIAVTRDLRPEQYEAALDQVQADVGIDLKVGVGQDRSAAAAGMQAKHALEECRDNGTDVEFARPVLASQDD